MGIVFFMHGNIVWIQADMAVTRMRLKSFHCHEAMHTSIRAYAT